MGPAPAEAMQVSIACTEHNLKSRNGEDRLLSKQSSAAPNAVSAARAKFRTVAIIARSLGTFTPQHHISLKESTAKQTGMKYRYASASRAAGVLGTPGTDLAALPALGAPFITVGGGPGAAGARAKGACGQWAGCGEQAGCVPAMGCERGVGNVRGVSGQCTGRTPTP